MDRLFYSPTREQQLTDGKQRYLWRAVQTGHVSFATQFAELYKSELVDVLAYEKLHAAYPLRGFWSQFTRDAE